MSKENNTIINIEEFKKECSKLSQICLSIQTLLENGSRPEHLKEIINEMREMSESIESSSKFLKAV